MAIAPFIDELLPYRRWRMHYTPVIPTFYWDSVSPEQQILELCRQWDAIIKYEDLQTAEVNEIVRQVNEMLASFDEKLNADVIAAVQAKIDDGTFTPLLEAAIQEWMNERSAQVDANTEAIRVNAEAIQGNTAAIARNEMDIHNIETEYVKAYETVARMKADPEAHVGMVVKTNGFFEPNDLGGAFYVFAENATANEMDVIAVQNGLFAILVEEEKLNVMQYGAKPNDNDFDNQPIFQYVANKANNAKKDMYIPNGTYRLNDQINLDDFSRFTMRGNSERDTILEFNFVGTAISAVNTSLRRGAIFKDLFIQNIAPISDAVIGVHAEKFTQGTMFDNVGIRGFYNNTYINQCYQFDINSATFSSASNYGLYLRSCYSWTVSNCVATYNGNTNIRLQGCRNGYVFGTDFSCYRDSEYNASYGVHAYYCYSCKISGYYEGNASQAGICTTSSESVSFENINVSVWDISNTVPLFKVDSSRATRIESCSCDLGNGVSTINSGIFAQIETGTYGTVISNCSIQNINKGINIAANTRTVLEMNTFRNTVENIIFPANTASAQCYVIAPDTTTTDKVTNKNNTGVSFKILNLANYGTTANRPSGVFIGQTYMNTSTNHLDVFNGSAWV